MRKMYLIIGTMLINAIAFNSSAQSEPGENTVSAEARITSDQVHREYAGPQIELRLIARTEESATVDVFVRRVSALRAFQVALEAIAGADEPIELEDIVIDEERPDFVYRNQAYVKALDQQRFRLAVALVQGGVNVDGNAYLATFRFRLPKSASEGIQIRVREGKQTQLRDSANRRIEFRTEVPLIVPTNGKPSQSRQPRR